MAESQPIRVLIVDDHAVVRSGLAAFLRAFPHLELVGQAAHGQQALEQARALRPDVILMDLVMPGMDGVDATRAICAELDDVRVLALTSFADDELVQRALQAGASGYLLKNVSHIELEQAIVRVHAGRAALAPEATEALLRSTRRPPALGHDLTDRERQVLALLVQGLSNVSIATELIITESTVKTHVSNILTKLGAANRTEAVAVALEHRLVT